MFARRKSCDPRLRSAKATVLTVLLLSTAYTSGAFAFEAGAGASHDPNNEFTPGEEATNVAIGDGWTSTGSIWSTAVGYGAKVGTDADGSTAIGFDAEIWNGSSNSTAVGVRSDIGENSGYSTAFGSHATIGANSADATALGASAGVGANAGGSTAVGVNASVSDNTTNALALGHESSVSHSGSVALGFESVANGAGLANAAWRPLDADGNPIAVAGINPTGEVSVGNAAAQRRLTMSPPAPTIPTPSMSLN